MSKLLLIINRFSVGGAERLVIDELHELHRQGIEAHVVTLLPEGRSSLKSELSIPENYVHFVAVRSLFSFSGVRALAMLIKELQPEAVICHLWYANTVGRIAARMAGTTQVYVFEHNVYEQVKTAFQFAVDRVLQRWTMKIIAVSESVKESLITRGIPDKRIFVLRNAIAPGRYIHAIAADVRNEFSISTDSFVILAVGRLIRQKGFDILIETLSHLPQQVHVILCGMGEEEQALKAQATTSGVEGRVHFAGVRHDIPALLKGVQCLAMPSRWEGEPIILLEALAAGVPIVGSDIAPLRSVIRNDKEGYLVAPDNAQAFAEGIEKILSGKREGVVSLPSDRTIEHHVAALRNLLHHHE